MKFRKKEDGGGKVDIQMAPMIDIVFQLLIFFMLTLKILAPEGDFNINMPLGAPATPDPDVTPPTNLDVVLTANDDGTLRQVALGGRPLGNNFPSCFQTLNQEIEIAVRDSKKFNEDIEVTLTPDYNLHHRYTVAAISACRGKVGPDGRTITFVEKIKFSNIQRPE
ncbi:MAG: biopolymer transporter ExbD [Planctomycetaceae bacterium]